MFGTDKVLGNSKGCKNQDESNNKEDVFVKTGSIKTERTAEGFLAGVHEDGTDDLAECKGYYRKIVAAKTKSRKTDYHSENCGNNTAKNKGNDKSGPFADHRFKNNRGFTAEICADAHETGMTEGKFTEEADNHAERNSKGNCDCNFFKKIFIGTFDNSGERKYCKNNGYRRNNDIVEVMVPFNGFKFFHYTFSLLFLPRIPVGLTRSIMIRIINSMASV